MTVKRGFQKAVGTSFSTLPRMAKHRTAQATKMAKARWTKKARLLEEKINGK